MPAWQSSEYNDRPAGLAVDGNSATDFFDASCTHTNQDEHPWWAVDLESEHTISHVTVTNRGDCCGKIIFLSFLETCIQKSQHKLSVRIISLVVAKFQETEAH